MSKKIYSSNNYIGVYYISMSKNIYNYNHTSINYPTASQVSRRRIRYTSINNSIVHILRNKGYYKVKLRGSQIDRNSILTKWRGRVVFYDFSRPLPKNLRRSDLLVLLNKKNYKRLPNVGAAVLEVIEQ